MGDATSWNISIHARSHIDYDSVVVTIPKTAVLSRKTSALSSVLQGKWLSDSHETVGLELALCLLYERCLGAASRFEPFLSILPRVRIPLPFLQDASALSSACSPWRWISGTETARINQRASYCYQLSSSELGWPYDHDYGMCKAKALDYFHSFGIPILARSKLFDATQRQHLDALQSAFLTAYTHVSSRDFIVDTYHGVGMVPVADLFNHAEVHTVQFESDQDVCEFCGVAFLTAHDDHMCRLGEKSQVDQQESQDDDDEQEDNASSDDSNGASDFREEANKQTREHVDDDDDQGGLELSEHMDTLDMRTLVSHSAGCEMYNTYGTLTNALLLTRYGFCLDTETDVERFTLDVRFPSERQAYLEAFVAQRVPGLTSLRHVTSVFDEVVSRIAEQFSQPDQSTAIDALHHLESLLPPSTPDWIHSTFCPLHTLSTSTSNLNPDPDPDPDPDLVDRDHIHPLFLSSTGQASLPLFLLTLLILLPAPPRNHAFNLVHSHLHLDSVRVQTALHTLLTFASSRRKRLYISKLIEPALVTLQLEHAYLEKACIQHAYQEYVATSTAISILQDLTSSRENP